MRLLKLFFYAVVGYVLYELYQGIRDGSQARASGGSNGGGSSRRDLDRALNEDQGRMQNLTGAGRGTTVSTADTDGASIKHVVGRGVVTQ